MSEIREIKTIRNAPGLIPEFNLLADEWGFVAKLGGVTISACHYGSEEMAIEDWNRFCDQMNLDVTDTPKRIWFCAPETAPEIRGDQIIGWQVRQYCGSGFMSPSVSGKRCADANEAVREWNSFVDELEAMR